jgi:hypothetical protein
LAPLAHGVSLPGGFDLDDVGAEIAEQLATERAGDELAHLHHMHAFERARADWLG